MSDTDNDAPKDCQIRSYVEGPVDDEIIRYAQWLGMTKSQAIRRLVILGLQNERRSAMSGIVVAKTA